MPRPPRRRTRKTGTIALRKGRWRIRWRVNGVQRSETFDTRADADEALRIRLGDVSVGKVGPARKKTRLDVLAEEWLKQRREAGHIRSIDDDESRWRNHIKPEIGHLLPDEVTPAVLRQLITKKLSRGRLRGRGKKADRKKDIARGLSPATVKSVVMLISTMFSDLVEDGHAKANPVSQLPKKVRLMLDSAHDPKTTPFIERLEDVRRIYLKLPEPYNVAYAVGALAGLRTGEIRALEWAHVDLERGRIHVQKQASASGELKDGDSRIVQIQASLLALLKAWRLRSQGRMVAPPKRKRDTYLGIASMGTELKKALAALGLPPMIWYQATRHTFASQWVLAGGSIEKLQLAMGHSSVVITQRYAHLRADMFTEKDAQLIHVDLSAPDGQLLILNRDAR